MSQTLTYVIGKDRRPHVDNVQDFKVNFDGSNTNWVQARQYERSMRQVFVNIKNEDGTPLDLTGCNVWFEGLLPKNSAGDFRVIDDKGYVALDPTAGRFRFDMPGHAFTVAGSYRQAFFRILKDGNSITTLEFDLDVLADKVIDGLVPRTYISPVEELINEIEAKYQDSTDKLTKMTSDFVDKFTQSMNTLKALGVTVQNGLDALEQKIKQDDLLTKGDIQAFEDTLTAKYQKLDDQIKSDSTKAFNHQYKYLSMSITIDNGINGQTNFDNAYSACKDNLMDFTLIDAVHLKNADNITFELTSDDMMKYAINKLQQNGRKIVMLKPHMYLADTWDPYRGNYVPSNISTYFTNWEKVLERDAQLCVDNNIPVLCIEVETDEVFSNANYEYARTMMDNLRQKFPSLKYTVANDKFFINNYQKIFELVDYIGINIYPSFSASVPQDISGTSTERAAEFMFNSDRLAEKIDDLELKFGKPIIVTEIGIYPFEKGLVQPLLSSEIKTDDIINGSVKPNFDATALAMRAAITGLAYTVSVIGLVWFESNVPMFFKDYYHEDLSVKNQAETVWNKLSEDYYWEGRDGE